jgi:RNA-directed DNA polymerase
VRAAQAQLVSARYVFKTDVRAYYASIDHHRLLDLLHRQIADRRILNLIGQYLRRRAERGGLIWEHRQGISLGCALSPLLGAAFLTALDEQLARRGV